MVTVTHNNIILAGGNWLASDLVIHKMKKIISLDPEYYDTAASMEELVKIINKELSKEGKDLISVLWRNEIKSLVIKNCKKCHRSMPYTAGKCPHCGAKQ